MSRMSELYHARELIEQLGGSVNLPLTPDEIAKNHMGGVMLSLKLARGAVREGGSYHNPEAISLARQMLDEIEASGSRQEEAA